MLVHSSGQAEDCGAHEALSEAHNTSVQEMTPALPGKFTVTETTGLVRSP